MSKKLVVALAGNPNSGKTTIFNNLTGSRQHVGNYPGVTVERKEGIRHYNNIEMQIIDLPGTYSLTAYSAEEVVTRNFILDEKPDVIVNIIDSSNLERNLYLTVQLMELGTPLVLAFNMSDEAKDRGYEFDYEKLSQKFNAPIVPTIGSKGWNMDELLAAAVRKAAEGKNSRQTSPVIHYGKEIEEEVSRIETLVKNFMPLNSLSDSRWITIKLLEHDMDVMAKINSPELLDEVKKCAFCLEQCLNEPPETAFAGVRYAFINAACRESVRSTIEIRHTISDRIDSILTHRILGLPIFLGMMYIVFQLTFTLGEPPMGWIESGFTWLGTSINTFWPRGSTSDLRALLTEGIIGGVGGVIVFLPNILLLFLAIAILEDSGYMARAAFIMDRMMHQIGLHGKSFIPMLLGFGCSVPAIMATRTLDNLQDRLTTMVVLPLISCGARFPIYALIIPAFFPPAWQGYILFSIYLTGIILAIVAAKLLRSTVFKGDPVTFVMELPPYRMPTARNVIIHMWERSWLYLQKAGTVILGISILLWTMSNYPHKINFDINYEAELEASRRAFINECSMLNTKLGLPSESNLLVQALQLDIDMNSAQNKFRRHEPGFSNAERERNLAIVELQKKPYGKNLSAFLDMREKITSIRTSFLKSTSDKQLNESQTGYSTMIRNRDTQMKTLRNADPEVFETALVFLDQIEPAFQIKVAGLEASKRSEKISFSLAGRLGHAMEPLLQPLGFDWKIGTALIGALAAKEVFVAQLGIVYSLGESDESTESLRTQLQKNYSPLAGFCIMLFCLISTPCAATIAVTKRESNSWKIAFLQMGGLTLLAYVITLFVYQTGSFFKIGI
ncbi:MAG: ferrous iron transport protein B [Candidatus Riflebacteria bacterium]|nr:ferrous iron transport protein B [Candidatus Riflebacteria bacterium]